MAKVKNRSESGFGQKAGSITINTALGVVCLPGHLSVCVSAGCVSSVSNHPTRKRDVEEMSGREERLEMMVSHITL